MSDENVSNEWSEKDDEIDIRELVLVLFRNWIIIVAATIVVAVGVAVYANLLPDQYVAKTVAVSGGGGGGNNQMAGLAALAGISMPVAGGGGINLMNFVDLLVENTAFNQSIIDQKWVIRRLQTREEQIARAPFIYDTMTLAQFWTETRFWKLTEPDTTVPDWQIRWNMAQVNTLRSNRFITIDRDQRTGILEIRTRFENPSLSYAVHQFLLEYLMEVIQEDRLNRGKESREFIEERVAEVRDNLHRAEARLVHFRERNLSVQSPTVMLEGERLGREVALHAGLYAELVRQLEIARIDERRESPAFEIIREADFPLGPSEPNRRLLYIIGLAGGFFAGIFSVFAKEWILSIIKHKNA
ncbi:MAG: Wzz/FepE/Etk N-terminal domain-containing protein [Chitinivibrionia bacterium]|jgi:uncharacterized protein involved in exopolysaccharide biosynthesis|nr:Wzz/FepE/Etk N-terminal domain-containing protein [Chitinivibrionia bacterium]